MSSRIAALFVVLALCATSVVNAQEAQPGRVTDEQVATINASIRARVRVLADSALARGLPAEVILDRARELTTKGIVPDRALAAVQSLFGRLETARAALGSKATGADVAVGAVAIGIGVRSQTLTKLSTERREATVLVSVGVLADLVNARVPVENAERIVLRLAAGGIRDAELTSIRDAVRSNISLGAVPTAAATAGVEAAIVTDAAGNITGIRNATGIRVIGRLPIRP